MMPVTTLPAVLCLALLGATAPMRVDPAGAAAPRAMDPAQDATAVPDLPEPEPPPELSATDIQKLERSFKKLTTKKLIARRAAEEAILAFGRGAVPHLVDEAATTSASKQAGVLRCLLDLTDVRDWPLVESCIESEQVALRRFAARKAGDLGLVHLAERLLARQDDEDPEVRLEAAVSVVTMGLEDGLEALAIAYLDVYRAERAGDDEDPSWPEMQDRGARIRAAMAGVQDAGSHAALVGRLQSDPGRAREDPEGAAIERQSAIVLLRAIGDPSAIKGLTKALDDAHNLVQRDAIDALRHLVEGEGPFAGASIFQQINEVNRLKALLKVR